MATDEFGRAIPGARVEPEAFRAPRVAPPRTQHPSERYADDPLLCEFLWKEQGNDGDYESYKKDYCLKYVRSFFNKHLDDSWFRAQYSPAVRKGAVARDRQRAAREAQKMRQEEGLIEQARLGRGGQSIVSRQLQLEDSSIRKRPREEETPVEAPRSHVLSSLDYLQFAQVPPHVTDGQILLRLADFVPDMDVEKDLYIECARPNTTTLERDAFVLANNPEILAKIREELRTSYWEAKRGPGNAVPRKDSEGEPVHWEVDVDCSDPYGRLEYDADEKGGPPGDGMGVPSRKATLKVHTQATIPDPPVRDLPASLSHKDRIPGDSQAARQIAKTLDLIKQIPDKLEDILKEKFGESIEASADVLDVSIAYLRRVHLFSFYDGCSQASCLGDMLANNKSVCTIHLRLSDDLLASLEESKQQEESAPSDEPPFRDMLVERLDGGIAKALDSCDVWIQGGAFYVDEETDRQADEIERAEIKMHSTWLDNHSVMDMDGRARCGFHFCRKLFKDSNFLRKHLIKKHGEYLKAEQAKCHDSAMMESWDKEEDRPVPEILVDCGQELGNVPAPVRGQEPNVQDPEPGLWERKQQAEEERRQRELERQKRREQYANRPRPEGGGFVDVDDMKVEKVELSFDDVNIPIVKKKKKKRKLL